ncbi:MAG: sulfite exporter TauE/SafE family protein [Planctomycetes bacterium]|nr:sulfite exporter TauE/SafE family protein [Planctomycetota bacterium]
MLYSPAEIALIGLIMTFGGVIQGAVGFASGMLGVPLLILSGFSLPEAATINLVSSGVQNIIGAWKLRSHLEPRELVFPVVLRWLAIPVGTYVAWLTDQHLSSAQSKQLIGMVLLVVVLLLWVCRVTPREHLNAFWQTLVFSTSGFMLGFATMGGSPMAIYVNSLTWPVAKSRAFLFACSAAGLPIAVVFFSWQYGSRIIPAAVAALIVMPGILAGLWLGLHLGHRLPKPLFRKITFALIVAIAAIAIMAPFFSE